MQKTKSIASPASLEIAFVVALAVGCGARRGAQPHEFAACADSPTEILRLEDTASGLPIDAFDLGNAVSVRYALQSESDPSKFSYPETFSVVDNCGGEPIRLANSFGLASGAANVGGDIVLCGHDGDFEGSVWQLLDDGTRGEDLGLGTRCGDTYPEPGIRAPSFGIVYDDGEVATQYLPDGAERVVSTTRAGFDLIASRDGAAVFSFGASVTIHPADGSAGITVELPEPVYSVYPAPGSPVASDWVLAIPRGKPGSATGSPRGDYDFPVAGYAIDLSTGAWFQSPEVILEVLGNRSDFSIADGLMATASEDVVVLSRAGWDRHLRFGGAQAFAVLDAERVFVASDTELRVLRAPLELPAEESGFEPEVLWSRPVQPNEVVGHGAGFEWNGMVIAWSPDFSAEVWAYPLDGGAAFPFVPTSEFGYLHIGAKTMIGLGVSPQSDDDKLWIFQRSFDGEFEVIADNLANGQDDFRWPTWTPELGRILYAVRDGDAVSIRQHVLE